MSDTLTAPAVTHYNSSSQGLIAIAAMPFPHIERAVAVLVRTNDPRRAGELAALLTEMASRPPPEALGADAPPGHNNPPEDEPAPVSAQSWPAIKADLDDDLTEARNWADGSAISTQAQADEVARLVERLRKGEALADAARKAEREPHDTVVDEIQARYNAYIAPLKNKTPGKVSLALDALKATQTAWLRKQEAEQAAEAERLRKIAEAKANEAAEAMRQSVGNIEAREQAEELFTEARHVERAAVKAETAPVHSFGETRNIGLRDNWITTIIDGLVASRWLFLNYRTDVEALALAMAQAEVRAGKRVLDGFTIRNERRV